MYLEKKTIINTIYNGKFSPIVKYLFISLILITLGILVHYNTISEGPKGVHRWSQSDHYAISLGYTENNLHLFKPQTYVLNPPIITPNVDSLQGITRVDFPLYHYLVGVTMKVSSCTNPFVQRLVSLIISLIGLFFLFKLVYKYTKSFWSGCIATLFVFSLPVYMYYQCNFLPSVPGLSLCFIGYYFYFNYLANKKKFTYFIISIAFFLCAILFRLPLAISFIAVCCHQFLNYIYARKIIWKEVLVLISAILIIAFYCLYNYLLGLKYGSIFLSGIIPPTSFEEFKLLLSKIYDTQKGLQYNAYIKFFLFVLVLNFIDYAIYAFIKRKPFTNFQKQLILQAIITLFGGLFYFVLMMPQFIYHDYYFLDSIYISIVLFVIFFISFIKWESTIANIFVKTVLFITLYFIFSKSHNQYCIRIEPIASERSYYIDKNIADIKTLLEKHSIGKDKTIYIMDDNLEANIAFCSLKRKGFCWNGYEPNRKWIEKADYIFVSEESLVNTIFKTDFALRYELSVVDKHGTIVMLEKADNSRPVSIYETAPINTIEVCELNFDEKPSPFWRIQDNVILQNDTTNYVAYVLPENEFTSTLQFPASKINPSFNIKKVSVDIDIFPLHENEKIILVISLDRDGKNFMYSSFDILEKEKGKWHTLHYSANIPDIHPNTDTFCVYLWNNEHHEFYYDNLKVSFVN